MAVRKGREGQVRLETLVPKDLADRIKWTALANNTSISEWLAKIADQHALQIPDQKV